MQSRRDAPKARWPLFGSVRLRFAHGVVQVVPGLWVPTVPLGRWIPQCFCAHKVKALFRFGFLRNGSHISVLVSGKLFRRCGFPVPVQFVPTFRKQKSMPWVNHAFARATPAIFVILVVFTGGLSSNRHAIVSYAVFFTQLLVLEVIMRGNSASCL